MPEELETYGLADDRPVYDAPRALRLGGANAGTGQGACLPGSGNANFCSTGNGAIESGCEENGNDAVGVCVGVGAGALADCLTTGEGFVGPTG